MVAGPNTFHMDDQKPSQILETEAWHGPAIEIVETDITATAGNLDVAMPMMTATEELILIKLISLITNKTCCIQHPTGQV